jgi:type IV pilus biogenesis protein PilP
MNSADLKTTYLLGGVYRLSFKDGLAKAGVLALVLGAVVAGSAVAIAQEEPASPAVPGQPITLTPPELPLPAQTESVPALPTEVAPQPASVSSVLPAEPATVVPTPTPAPAPVSANSPLSVLPEAVVSTADVPVEPVPVPEADKQPSPAASGGALSTLYNAATALKMVSDSVPAAEPAKKEEPEPKPVEALVDPRVKADEVINSLRQGTFTKPLSLTDMAAINDAIQRMNYLSDIERKMAELNPNMVSSTTPVASAITGASPAMMPQGAVAVSSPTTSSRGTVTVLQISGSQGKFKALVNTQDGRTMYVHVGDSLADGQIVGIDLAGVRVRGSYGLDILPFRSQAPVLIGQ